MKSSSRSGRFKKRLVSPEELLTEAPRIEAKMAPILDMHRKKQITDCEFTALFILVTLSIRYPGTWAGAKRPSLEIPHQLSLRMEELEIEFEPNIKKRLSGLNLGDVFNQFALKSTPEAVNRAILKWSTGTYPLELMFRIPSPLEVLEQQKFGRRCVSVLIPTGLKAHYILGERDSLSFTMHDLIHADHFFHHNECYYGQLALYGFLDSRKHDFLELLKNADFLSEFDYLISDMNAYAIHSLKCLKAAIIHYGSKEEFSQWVEEFEIKEHLLLLNSADYVPEKSDPIILKWLEQFRRI
jgi:hypothetical protein